MQSNNEVGGETGNHWVVFGLAFLSTLSYSALAGGLIVSLAQGTEPVAGTGFELAVVGGAQTTVAHQWTRGTTQAYSLLLRGSVTTGQTTLTHPGTIPPDLTAVADNMPMPDPIYCDVLVSFSGDPSPAFLGNSDVMCFLPNTRTGSIPYTFGVRLNQGNVASLTWSAATQPAGLSGFTLVAVPLSGSPAQLISLGPTVASYNVDTRGVATCFVLVPLGSGGAALGNTEAICPIPGAATVSAHGGIVSITGAPGFCSEGAACLFNVYAEPGTGVASVNVTTVAGTATGGSACSSGVDYVSVDRGVVLERDPTHVVIQTVLVTSCADGMTEGSENFQVRLSLPSSNATIAGPSTIGVITGP